MKHKTEILTCHCKKVQLKLKLEKGIEELVRCNCSLCKRRGSIMAKIKLKDLKVIKDKAKFTKVSPKVIEKDFISMSSMKQWILEEDIGKMCSFLISDDSMRVSGQVISVDGHTERND